MVLCFYNTLSNRKEEFKPLSNGPVKIYSCGPTLYDYPHIGNYKTYIFEDILRRYLKYKGYAVKQVMNLTDVDDKTIRDSRAAGVTLGEFTKKYGQAFFEDLKVLNIEPVEVYPRATEHIDDMVTMIRKLMEKGMAYRGDDQSIYYDISRFRSYGKLSNIQTGELQQGMRISEDEYGKLKAGDFALWKAWSGEEVFWETELGKGRPGWHIECSAMSTRYLGNHFDIHTGGVDNIFPHHENEIAQCEGVTGEPFVNYWLHAEHLIVEGQKMSKSLGNFYTLRDLLAKGYSPMAIRLLLAGTRYRQKLNFTFNALDSAEKGVERLQHFALLLSQYVHAIPDDPAVKGLLQQAAMRFEKAMDDDLNTSEALSVVYDLVRDVNRAIESGTLSTGNARMVLEHLEDLDRVLGIIQFREVELTNRQRELVQERQIAREHRDWQRADEIRQELEEQGFTIIDRKFGSIVKK